MMKQSDDSLDMPRKSDSAFTAMTALILGVAAWLLACAMRHPSPIATGLLAALIASSVGTSITRRRRSRWLRAALSIAGVVAFMVFIFYDRWI